MESQTVKLKVGELTSRDEYGKGIARMDIRIMKQIGAKEGDVIEIKGKKSTGAIVVRPYPSDIGLNIIRMDGLVRKNADVSVGETVSISKPEMKEAKKVIFAPTQKNIHVQMPAEMLGRGFFRRPMKKGDIVVPTTSFPRGGSNLFETLFGANFDMFGGGMESFGSLGTELKLVVVKTIPEGIAQIVEGTEIELKPQAVDIEEVNMPTVTYEDIGGLHEELGKVRELIELPMRHPELFDRLGIEPPKGIMMFGPPGTGKTLLARAVASESGAHFISINGPEIVGALYGQSEHNLRKVFKEAEENAPSIIFIDEIDAIAPKRGEVTGEVERRMVSQLLTLMDGLNTRGKVIVIAATNRPDSIDEALRRPGRFDREIEIGVPDKKGRREIMDIHTRHMPLAKEVDLNHIASVTYGFVGADLNALCKEAAMHVLRRSLIDVQGLKEDQPLSEDILKKLTVTKKDFDYALKMIQPSAMREVMVEVPRVKWTDVGGLEITKERLKESVEWPLKNPESFSRMGIKPPKGILLYGPPGTGKTLLAKAVASESDANFISIKGPQILSKWVGESEKHIREIFKKARQVAPCVIFFDEIDSLAPARHGGDSTRVSENVVSQLLTEMSGLEDLKDVVVLAATNRPDMMDPALLRPGRFDRQILIPAPDLKARESIFSIHTKGMPIEKDVKIETLAEKTDGYSGADIEAICREAGLNALREDTKADKIKMKHFNHALKDIQPSIDKEIVEYYNKIDMRKKGADVAKEDIRYVG